MALILKAQLPEVEPENVLHSSQDPDWYTPGKFAAAAREVMGAIDLDPCSDEVANDTFVKALHYYDISDNGLLANKMWSGRIFINPPGGLVKEFWIKLMEEEHVTEFIWIGYSLEQLQTLQNIDAKYNTPLDYTICYLKQRISFIENSAKRALRKKKMAAQGKPFLEKNSPTHGNYIAYFGPNIDKFEEVFEQFGQIVVPSYRGILVGAHTGDFIDMIGG